MLPVDIENIIYDYVYQMNVAENKKKVNDEIKTYRRILATNEGIDLFDITNEPEYWNKYRQYMYTLNMWQIMEVGTHKWYFAEDSFDYDHNDGFYISSMEDTDDEDIFDDNEYSSDDSVSENY